MPCHARPFHQVVFVVSAIVRATREIVVPDAFAAAVPVMVPVQLVP